jgi:hypothetical protein
MYRGRLEYERVRKAEIGELEDAKAEARAVKAELAEAQARAAEAQARAAEAQARAAEALAAERAENERLRAQLAESLRRA